MIAFLRRQLGVSKQLLKNRLRKNRGKRRYIHPRLGVKGFFLALKEHDIQYSVLRWFETLPDVEAGEDIDILIADEDIHRLEPFLTGTKSYGQPCDIYTASGLPGTSYRGIAYFPEHLARELLESAIWQAELVRVPDPRRHLFSMVYHAVYHKGYESGVPSETGKNLGLAKPDHDYPKVISACAAKIQLAIPEMTLEGLDRFLSLHNWNPSRDALEKLSSRNEWIQDHFFTNIAELEPFWGGFSVFIVREQGLEQLNLVRTMLFDAGFDILFEHGIDKEQRLRAAKNLRGGNWNRGPWPVSGGLPAWMFVVNDCFPVTPGKELVEKHPGLANSRLLDTKVRIRDAVNNLKTHDQRSNVIHSADNPHQGLEYLKITFPDSKELDEIEKRLKESWNVLCGRVQVIQALPGHGRRARVELIRHAGMQAVCKTYRPGRERYLKRELLARQLGRELPEMSPILEHGDNFMVMPYYQDRLDRTKLLPLWMLRRTRAIISHFRSLGYEMIDFKPKNIILDEAEGMKIIDFEFLQPGGSSSSSLKGNFCWYSVSSEFKGDVPAGKKNRRNNYYHHWFASTGIPLWCAVREIPDWLLVPIRITGQVVLSLHHRLVRAKQNIRGVKDRFKRVLISLLGKIIG